MVAIHYYSTILRPSDDFEISLVVQLRCFFSHEYQPV